MKVLVTGSDGFIGSNAVKKLVNIGYDVDTFEWDDRYPNNLPTLYRNKYDVVMHFGAISSTVEKDIDKIMRQNYDFSCNLLHLCNLHDIDLQYSSSASVYGFGRNFSEAAPPDPKNAYAMSKYLFERYVSKHKWDITVQGFRYFNVYGPGEDHKGTQASPFHQFKKQADENGYVRVFENSKNYLRDFVHVDKVIDYHLKFLEVKESGVWNIGEGKTISFLDVARKFSDNIVEIPMPDVLKMHYQEYTCADMTKTKNTLEKYNVE